jgi:hypothetical protein
MTTSPEQVQTQINAWTPVAAVLGGAAWHFILQIAPWAKANGGLLRGVKNFFWAPQPPKP